MTYYDLVRNIELYLHIQGSEARYLIKDFINSSILDFIRIFEWKYTRNSDIITLNGSGQYDLSTVLSMPFYGELSLLSKSGQEYTKYNYDTYLRLTSKAYAYAIFGNNLYVEGNNNDLTFLYVTPGTPYPLADDDDENLVTLYYWDIIKKMTIIKMLNYLDDETVAKEENDLKFKLVSLKEQERRIQKQGKFKMVRR